MTDRLEAARAFVAAGDALNSPEHAADVEQLREISNRVTARQEAYDAAQEALFAADRRNVDFGAEPAADNTQAKAVMMKEPMGFSDQMMNIHHRGSLDPVVIPHDDEFGSSRANGAYAED